jgi:Dolichyl-phosphate-mannose-protein mannosyltransferase
MGHESDGATSLRFSPRLARLLAFGWAAALAFVYLFHYDGWLAVIQLGHFGAISFPTLHFGPHFGEFVRGHLGDALCVLVILAAAFAVGAVVVNRVTPEKSMLTALFALAIGLWALAVATLCVGAISVPKIPWVLVLLTCWALSAPRKFLVRPSRAVQSLDGWSRLMLAFIIVTSVLCLLPALTPPFEYDSLEYHLGAPADYVRAGHIIFLPHNFYSNMPQVTEMLYLLAMTISSDVAAKMLHWGFGVLGALAVYAVAVRLWGRRVALTAAALFYCIPYIEDLSSTARIDLATTFFAVLTFGALLQEKETKKGEQWLWLSAMAAGATLATKWTASAVVLLPAVACVIICRKSVRLAAGYLLVALLPVVPWILKNWLLTGNPVYPLLYGMFPSPYWSPQQAAMLAEKHSPHFDANGLKELWELPWRYSFTENGALPVLLMTAPLILLVRNADRAARYAAWMLVTAFAGWYLFTFRPWRFLFPVFPLAAMVGAFALDAVDKWCRALVAVVMVVGLAVMGLNLVIDIEIPEQVPPHMSILTYVLGQQSRQDFIARIGRGALEPIEWMNQNLPADAKVLYVGEGRAYYAKQTVLWSTAFDQHPLDEIDRVPADVESLREALHARGIKYVYVNFSEWERLRAHYNYLLDIDNTALRNLLQQHAKQIHTFGRGIVWGLE